MGSKDLSPHPPLDTPRATRRVDATTPVLRDDRPAVPSTDAAVGPSTVTTQPQTPDADAQPATSHEPAQPDLGGRASTSAEPSGHAAKPPTDQPSDDGHPAAGAPPEQNPADNALPAAAAQHASDRAPEPEDDWAVASELPGSDGEHLLQQTYGTRTRAERFYNDQMCDRLNESMIEFVQRMEMAFIATADASGAADCSLRAGPPGFIHVLDDRHVAYPEYRGNGVLASLGNISENPNVGIMLIDFVRDRIGLHINGHAKIVDDDAMRAAFDDLPTETVRGRMPERWVLVEVDEAYIHCRKHIPGMQRADADQAWGSDDVKRKGGDYFGVRADRKAAATDRAPQPVASVASSDGG